MFIFLGHSAGSNTGLIAGLSVMGAVIGIALIGTIVFLLLRRRSHLNFDEEELDDMRTKYLSGSGTSTGSGTATVYQERTNVLLGTGVWNVKYEDLKIMMPALGRGAFGVVYRAEFHGTFVAVKTYVGEDPTGELQADWAREISNLAKLHHPNIMHPTYC
jgi:hypothetical protein